MESQRCSRRQASRDGPALDGPCSCPCCSHTLLHLCPRTQPLGKAAQPSFWNNENNGVLYSHVKGNFQYKSCAHFNPCVREQSVGRSHSSRKTTQGGPLAAASFSASLPSFVQGHTACGSCPCNSPASSTAPGSELIRPRQGSKSNRRERRGKECDFNPKTP